MLWSHFLLFIFRGVVVTFSRINVTDSLSVGVVCVRFLGSPLRDKVGSLVIVMGIRLGKSQLRWFSLCLGTPGHLLGEMFGHVQLPDSFTQE